MYRESITIGKIQTVTAQGGSSTTEMVNPQTYLAAWQQLAVPMEFGGQVDGEFPTARFILPLPQESQSDDPKVQTLLECDSGYSITWRNANFRVKRVFRDPIALTMFIDCAAVRRA